MKRKIPKIATIGGEKYLDAATVMTVLKYTDRSAFWKAVRDAGIPFIRINQRRCLFEESSLRAWLDSRRVGSVPAR